MKACGGCFHVSRNVFAIPSSIADVGLDPVEEMGMGVSACPTTDDRVDIGTTPAIGMKARAL